MLDYVALMILIFVILTVVYGVVYIHDIPYEIAKSRSHPHQDAIHVAGWVSLFTLHAIWPFLWIWATMYRPGHGYGFSPDTEQLQARIEELEGVVRELSGSAGSDQASKLSEESS
jgi:hypothetical protein